MWGGVMHRCDCEVCYCNLVLTVDEYLDGRCEDCQDGYHEDTDPEYDETLENAGWGSWDDGGLR